MRAAILVPCHNAARYLPELLDGVAAQTLPFDEVLCYDDASSDDTAAVALAHGATVLRGSVNRGPAFARNRLLEATTCDWAHFHDADDHIDPRFLERMASHVGGPGGPGDPDVILCTMRVVERSTGQRAGHVAYDGLRTAPDSLTYFLEHMGFAIVGLYRRDVVRAVGGFREDLLCNEDPDLHVRLALAGARFAVESEALVTNLMRPDSFSVRHRVRALQDRLLCLTSYATAGIGHTPVLGRQALSIAWLLFDAGDRAAAREAVALARRCGVRAIDSHRLATRLLSRSLGPTPVFWLRKLLWSATRP